MITYNEGPRDTQLKLEDYYEGEEEPTEKSTEHDVGAWVLLRKTVPIDDGAEAGM